MNYTRVIKLAPQEVKDFWLVFAELLRTKFPGYSEKIIRYFLEKIYTQSSYVYWLENNMKTVLVAKDNEIIVGFAVIDEPYGGVSFCRWLGVKQEYQKKGIGTMLINAWIDLAKSQHCHKVEIASQPEAKDFYEKVGLNQEGERKLSYFGITQYVFGKVIGKPDEEEMTK